MSGEPLHAYVVAVVGDGGVMSDVELYRLLAALVARHRDSRRICLLSAGRHSPELTWCQGVRWDLQPVAQDEWVRRECEIVAWAHARGRARRPRPLAPAPGPV